MEDDRDLVFVRNIDLNCQDVQAEHIKVSKSHTLPDGVVTTEFEDQEELLNHADGFTVKWDGHAFTIKPGQTLIMPRFLAHHYANHLAQHMLTKSDKKSRKQDRPIDVESQHQALMDTIITGTAQSSESHKTYSTTDELVSYIERINKQTNGKE